LHVDPRTLVAVGLLMAAVSGMIAMLAGYPFLTGAWLDMNVFGLMTLHLGSPILFDLGVYSVVLGVTVLLVFSFAEEEEM
jgi:multicomponent Na+:H+ antiporter subunit B